MGAFRILHCLIGNMNVGGIENVIMQIYRNIDRKKFQFDFIVHDSKKNFYEDDIKSLGGQIYRVPYVSKRPFYHCRKFWKLLKEHEEYRIVHIHTTYAITWFDALIAHLCGRIVVIHSHNSNATKVHAMFHKLFRKSQAGIADYRISCSEVAGQWMFGDGVSYDIWKNAISLAKFRFDAGERKRVRRELGIDEKVLVFGTVGRLSYQKNLSFMIDAFAQYQKHRGEAYLLIVGGGEDKEVLEKKTKELGLIGKIIFTGMQSEVQNYMFAMDVFLLTSRWEGFGIAMVEAQGTGLPVLASPVVDSMVVLLDTYRIMTDMTIDTWVSAMNEVEKTENRERLMAFKTVLDSGFDICTQVKKTEEFYERVLHDSLEE